jgi:hypothetical protein
MEVKLLEVRDRMTFVPMLALKPVPHNEEERYLLARAGYGRSPDDQSEYVLLARLDGGELHYDSCAWHNQRTCGTIHRWLQGHWAEVQSGDVVDVEFILGETSTPKVSERTTAGTW